MEKKSVFKDDPFKSFFAPSHSDLGDLGKPSPPKNQDGKPTPTELPSNPSSQTTSASQRGPSLSPIKKVPSFIRQTYKVRPAVHKAFSAIAFMRRRDLQDVVHEALGEYLNKEESQRTLKELKKAYPDKYQELAEMGFFSDTKSSSN